jgi:hypothetical protein
MLEGVFDEEDGTQKSCGAAQTKSAKTESIKSGMLHRTDLLDAEISINYQHQ